MAKYKLNRLDKWAAKIERRLNHVAETATREVFEVAQEGVPVASGKLKASLTFATGSGPKSHLLASTALTPGKVRGLWHSPYALLAHYGGDGRPGTFWRINAIAEFPQIVAKATEKSKRLHP